MRRHVRAWVPRCARPPAERRHQASRRGAPALSGAREGVWPFSGPLESAERPAIEQARTLGKNWGIEPTRTEMPTGPVRCSESPAQGGQQGNPVTEPPARRVQQGRESTEYPSVVLCTLIITSAWRRSGRLYIELDELEEVHDARAVDSIGNTGDGCLRVEPLTGDPAAEAGPASRSSFPCRTWGPAGPFTHGTAMLAGDECRQGWVDFTARFSKRPRHSPGLTTGWPYKRSTGDASSEGVEATRQWRCARTCSPSSEPPPEGFSWPSELGPCEPALLAGEL